MRLLGQRQRASLHWMFSSVPLAPQVPWGDAQGDAVLTVSTHYILRISGYGTLSFPKSLLVNLPNLNPGGKLSLLSWTANKSFLCPERRYFLHLPRLFTIQTPLERYLGDKSYQWICSENVQKWAQPMEKCLAIPCIKTPHWLFIIYWINSFSHINQYYFVAFY